MIHAGKPLAEVESAGSAQVLSVKVPAVVPLQVTLLPMGFPLRLQPVPDAEEKPAVLVNVKLPA